MTYTKNIFLDLCKQSLRYSGVSKLVNLMGHFNTAFDKNGEN